MSNPNFDFPNQVNPQTAPANEELNSKQIDIPGFKICTIFSDGKIKIEFEDPQITSPTDNISELVFTYAIPVSSLVSIREFYGLARINRHDYPSYETYAEDLIHLTYNHLRDKFPNYIFKSQN
jgi:hypothetical protein